MKDKFTEAIWLMKLDLAYFEEKYQGKFLDLPHIGLGNRKTRCVNEATLPIVTCHPSCLEKCAGTCYVLKICTLPRPACRKCEAKNTVLRRIDPAAYYKHFYDVTYVVSDGTGNCPYQKSLARFNSRKYEIARELRVKGVSTKDANRRAEKLAGEEVKVWHCRNCSEHGTGCCGSGDIRFNVVGESGWAVKAEQKELWSRSSK